MNRFTRMLTMAGLGLVTGVAIGAGPAMAADTTGQGATRSEVSSGPWFDYDNDRVVGFFRSFRACDWAGEFGEDQGWWEDYDCEPVYNGFHRSRVALVVDDFDGFGHRWNGRWPSSVGHWWPGHHIGGGFHHRPLVKPWIRPGGFLRPQGPVGLGLPRG